MKLVLGLVVLGAMTAPAWPTQAQPAPPGSYQRQCQQIRMEGQFLHALCRSGRAWVQSSINVLSCRTDIWVGPDGGLTCSGGGPGAGSPEVLPYPPPGDYRPPPSGGWNRWSLIVYDRPGWRGRRLNINGDTPNLDGTRFNDRVASIRLAKRTGPWLVCSDKNFRGRCVTVGSDVGDTASLGMLGAVSSLRPLREDRPWPQPR
jgi:hypothetical protein